MIKPEISKLRNSGRINLGGYGEMYLYKDEKEQSWLFKPAQDKSGKSIEYRAYIQEVAYELQKIVELSSAVPIFVVVFENRIGTIQPYIEKSISSDVFYDWQKGSNTKFSSDLLKQFLREHIVDWLIANFDSYGANFIVDKCNVLRGLDKEQGYKYIEQEESRALCLEYHPNKKFGAIEPIYNTIYKRYISNELELDFYEVEDYIKRVEAFSDEEYLKLFKNFIEAYEEVTTLNEKIAQIILDRKRTLRETFSNFYSYILSEKHKQKDTDFQFKKCLINGSNYGDFENG